LSTIEKRRCDICGETIVSDELYSIPAGNGWGKLLVRGLKNGMRAYDLCPTCLDRIPDYCANRRATIGPSLSAHCTPSTPPRSSPDRP